MFHSLSFRERKRQMRSRVIEGKYVFWHHQRFSSWAEGLGCLNDGSRRCQRWNSSWGLINGAMKTCRLCRGKMTDRSLSHLEMVGQPHMLQKQVDANICKDWPLPLSWAKHIGQLRMVFKPFTIYEIWQMLEMQTLFQGLGPSSEIWSTSWENKTRRKQYLSE